MRVNCPNCRQALEAPGDFAGRKVRCQGCKSVFVIPKPQEPPFEAPPLQPESEYQLSDDVAPTAARCPACKAEMAMELSVCARCGFNRRTGQSAIKATHHHVSSADEKSPVHYAIIEFISTLIPGLFHPITLITCLILSLFGIAIVGMGIWVALALFAPIEGAAIGGVGLILHAQSLGVLLYGEWAFLTECLSELDGRRWLMFVFLLFAPFAAAYFIIHAHLPANSGPTPPDVIGVNNISLHIQWLLFFVRSPG